MQGGQGVQLVRPRRQHDHIGIAELPNPAQDFKAVNIAKANVQGNNAGLLIAYDLDPLATARCAVDVKSRLAQHSFDEVAYIFVVFHNDGDSQVSHGPPHI
ncbi:hypothetical protein NicSoilB8_33410 [Arthrobacter sp. NicSoilB8]|nr:hypothetical protein NicSoilB8_33410 [Arthrobacter sp. NicSoilB8]